MIKKLLLILATFLIFTPVVHSQTRVLVGPEGGYSFDNGFVGPSVQFEVPIKNIELDLKDSFYPAETHVSLGNGWANQAQAGGYVWFNKWFDKGGKFGLDGNVEYSNYHTSISKGLYYYSAGFAYRGIVGGQPTRVTFNYLREFKNGIFPDGIETSRLQGGEVKVDTRFGCTGPFCIRNVWDFQTAAVYPQGNPVCDGTFGVTGGPNGGPCPRRATMSGGFSVSIYFEFPRRKNTEDLPF